MLCLFVSQKRNVSIVPQPGDSMDTKPSIEEVLQYAQPLILKFIGQFACDLPEEHKEEIVQTANLRLLQAYTVLDVTKGWKSFVYNHSKGAVLDYLKFGAGFQESKWSIAKTENHESKYVSKIRERISLSNRDDETFELDQVLGANGIFSELEIDKMEIRWELVARMARIDQCIHAMALHLLGNGIEEIAPGFDKCRSRIGQLIQAFVDRFDEPLWAASPWFLQMCYAFGLCKALGIPDVDQSTIAGNGSCGWDLEPIDLESLPELPDEPEQLALKLE